MKKISFLAFIPGKLNYFSKKNFLEFKKNIGPDLNFFLFPWEDTEKKKINNIFKKFRPQIVFHIAGQPGVLYSFKNPLSLLMFFFVRIIFE